MVGAGAPKERRKVAQITINKRSDGCIVNIKISGSYSSEQENDCENCKSAPIT